MSLGHKQSPDGTVEIDFDNIYKRAILPAAHDTDMDVVRSDEERMGGFIHASVYQRLFVAEIAVVSLTFANPNVFDELGVRHAARPRTTIMIYSSESTLPFDVRLLRAIPYQLDEDGRLDNENADHLRTTLVRKLRDSQQDEFTDSPLFQLISSFPGITLPHEATEAFRDRARYIDGIRVRIEQARLLLNPSEALQQLLDIEKELALFATAPPELLVDLMLTYRDLKAVDNMVRLVERLPKDMSEHRTIQEQLAFALNRRNIDNDRGRAIQVLETVIANCGIHPETCGIMGRVYKDMYSEAVANNELLRAGAYLSKCP